MLAQGKPPDISNAEYRRVQRVLALEVVGLALILSAAPLMARGVGLA